MVSLHGDMTSVERHEGMKQFRSGLKRILITTDLLARGIDVSQVSYVINYDIPSCRENYVHRIGRSGCYGRKGTSITFVTDDEQASLRELEHFYHTRMEDLTEEALDAV